MKPAPKTTQEFRSKVVADYLERGEGVSSDDIAKKHGLKNGHTVQNWAWEARNGGRSRTPTKPIKGANGKRERLSYDADFKRSAVAAYQGKAHGEDAATVCKRLGLKSVQLLYRWSQDPALQGGVAPRHTEPPRDARSNASAYPDELKRQAVAFHLSGNSLPMTAKEFGIGSSSIIHKWKNDTRYQPNGTAALATNGIDPRQVDLFEAPQVVNRVEPHVTPQAIERLRNEVNKLREENARLIEDNNILRAIGTVAVQRGTLDLFLAKGIKP
jgi:transposase-like protein